MKKITKNGAEEQHLSVKKAIRKKNQTVYTQTFNLNGREGKVKIIRRGCNLSVMAFDVLVEGEETIAKRR